jgi:hypothetical protein
MPSGGQGEYHYVHTDGSAMVVPIADTGELLLVNQYRYLACGLRRERQERRRAPGGPPPGGAP